MQMVSARLAVRLGAIALVFSTAICIAVESNDQATRNPQMDLTLQEAIVIALRNSHSLIQARLRRSVERYALKLAESEFQPRFVTEAYAQNHESVGIETENSGLDTSIRLRIPTGGEFALVSRVIREGNDGSLNGSDSDGSLELVFSQPLLRGGGFAVARSTVRTARNLEEMNILSFKSEIMSLTSLVIRTYRNYVQSRTREEIAIRSLERARELLEINQLLVATGRMAEQDVVQTQADIARRELDLLASQGRLEASRLALIDVLDIETDVQFGEMDRLELLDLESELLDPAKVRVLAFQQRPDYLQTQLRIKNAENRHLVARNNRLWDLSLTLGRSFQGEIDQLTDTSQRVSLDLEIPVGRAAAGPAELQRRQALADLEIARSELNELRQQIVIAVENAVRSVKLAYQGAQLAGRARELANQKAEVEREKLSLGVTSNFQLVTFENDLVLAEISELNAIADYLNAITELDRVLGGTLDRWDIEIENVEVLEQTPDRFEAEVD